MKRKKFQKFAASLISVFMIAAMVLTGCGAGEEQKETTASTTETTAAPTPVPTTAEPSPTPIPATKITYALWGDKEKAKMEIEKFNEQFPQITVEIDPEMDWPWDEKLAAAAAANKLPDVFWVFQAPVSAQAGLLADLTPFLERDKDFGPDLVFGNFFETAKYNDKYYALPNGLFSTMIYVNKDLLAKENIPMPSADWTFEQMAEIAVKVTKPSENQYGLDSANMLMEHLYQNIDSTLGWSTLGADGKYHFTNPALAQAIDMARDLAFEKKVTLDQFTDEQKVKKYGKDIWPPNTGKIAFTVDWSWDMPYCQENFKFDYDILPMPKINDQRIGMVNDYIGMSAVTKSPDASFEFIKYMTYSKQGALNRIDIYNPSFTMPLIKDKEVWDKYMKQSFAKPGLANIVALIPKAYMDGMKWMPGWSNSMNESWWKYGGKFLKGEAKLADVAAEMEQKANQAYTDALDALANLK